MHILTFSTYCLVSYQHSSLNILPLFCTRVSFPLLSPALGIVDHLIFAYFSLKFLYFYIARQSQISVFMIQQFFVILLLIFSRYYCPLISVGYHHLIFLQNIYGLVIKSSGYYMLYLNSVLFLPKTSLKLQLSLSFLLYFMAWYHCLENHSPFQHCSIICFHLVYFITDTISHSFL